MLNVIIVCAGKSQRFKSEGFIKPKFLLEINNRTVLENICSQYQDNTNFILIVNGTDYEEYKKLINKTINKIKKKQLIIIDSHSLGPVESLDKISSKIKGEVIISYCDFLVEWNYKNFKRFCFGKKIVVPIFSGFHPASFGDTFYDYVKLNSDKSTISKISIKKPLSKFRHKEPAVAGIYYFETFDIFKKYIKKFKISNTANGKEVYVSSIVNLLISEQKAYIYQLNKFICLGTPRDYWQYKNFEKYFINKKNHNSKFINQKLLPMAGKGSRMKKKKFNTMKPYITINSLPMYYYALNDHPVSKTNFLVVIEKEFNKYNYKKIIDNLNTKIIKIASGTNSQVETCLLAEQYINPDQNILISSCDYGLSYDDKKLKNIIKNTDADIIIWTYKLKNILYSNKDNFAYIKNKNDEIMMVQEKKTVSNNYENDDFVIGTFFF